MIKKTLLLALVLTSCSGIPEPDIAERLEYQKNQIDGLIAEKEGEIVNDSTELFYDENGDIKALLYVPLSESGDWFMETTHYFDQKGKTFAYQQQISYFYTVCADGMAQETMIEFFDSNFQVVAREHGVSDGKEAELNLEQCRFPFEWQIDPSESFKDYETVNL